MISPTELLPALPWLAPFASLLRLANSHPSLSHAPLADGTLVSVIIPARNESATVETVVRSVLASTYRPLELLVVDDRSTDETAEIVERLAAEHPSVRLVPGEPLPPGWYGKPWACIQGYRAAKGELLLFTDADTRHEPELLAQHYTAAGLPDQAVSYWHRAGQRASERSADQEAIAHLTRGLELARMRGGPRPRGGELEPFALQLTRKQNVAHDTAPPAQLTGPAERMPTRRPMRQPETMGGLAAGEADRHALQSNVLGRD